MKNYSKKIALSFLSVVFASSCNADFISLRSMVDFLSENKIIATIGAVGFGGILAGKILSNKRKIDNKEQFDAARGVAYANNVGLIQAQLVETLKEGSTPDEYAVFSAQCKKEAEEFAQQINTQQNLTFCDKAKTQKLSTLFWRVESTTGEIKNHEINNKLKNGKKLTCTQIKVQERLTWLPNAAYTVGGLSLVTAGIMGAVKLAANKK